MATAAVFTTPASSPSNNARWPGNRPWEVWGVEHVTTLLMRIRSAPPTWLAWFKARAFTRRGTFTLLNSIVAGNAPDSAGNILGGFPTSTPNLTSGDPLLQPLAYYGGPTPTMPPLTNSPAINAGSVAAAGPLGTDQRGLPRILENLVDLGAVEVRVKHASPRFGRRIDSIAPAYQRPLTVHLPQRFRPQLHRFCRHQPRLARFPMAPPRYRLRSLPRLRHFPIPRSAGDEFLPTLLPRAVTLTKRNQRSADGAGPGRQSSSY